MITKEEIKRQHDLDAFVKREVLFCQTHLVEDLIKEEMEGFSVDDIENLFKTEEELLDEGYTKEQIAEGDCQDIHEVFEWWLVTECLANDLREENQVIIENDYGHWWGRCTPGQAISMDYVIGKIWDKLGQAQS